MLDSTQLYQNLIKSSSFHPCNLLPVPRLNLSFQDSDTSIADSDSVPTIFSSEQMRNHHFVKSIQTPGQGQDGVSWTPSDRHLPASIARPMMVSLRRV